MYYIKNITQNKFDHSNVYLSFNGGKDSVVAFHLYRIASHEFSTDKKGCELQAVYFKDPSANEFSEITSFIHAITSKYGVNLRVVEDKWERGVKSFENSSFILGSRSMDEGCADLKPLEAGNAGDFEFYRINPILNWTYGDIWDFLLYFQLEYCPLYDQGYTSIGTVDDTLPNPYLKSGDTYLPAYKLTQWEHERCSRVKQ
ncbi:FAD synthase [Theileria orientalis]|uniref:FAD synthase n=1 Tax=Theileria orientalis TaxID=68886 RepID=A0A976M672_THEOR|nr:FAD synthase [Theileria orientalis]